MDNIQSDDTFLTKAAVRRLTGRAQRELQVDVLRSQGVPFFIDAFGWPVVARTAVEGRSNAPAAEAPRKGWVPRVLTAG